MDRNRYVQIPITRESRTKLKNLTKVMKLKYDKFMGYDEVIEELERMYLTHDQYTRDEIRRTNLHLTNIALKEKEKK